MKRILRLILLASAVSALLSCVKEEEFASPIQEAGNLIITATQEGAGPATKTELVDGNTYWSVGDKISVFFGSGTAGGAEFTSLNTEPSASADFTGILTAVTGSENGSSSKKYFWGVYPYSANNSVTLSGNSNYLTTVVNDTQYGVADSFSAGQNIWIGRDLGLELSFKSLLSGIKFTFSRDDIIGITIKGNNGEYLAGKVNVVMDSGVPEVSDVVEGKTRITLKPENGGTFQTGAVYRALFLPTNFTQGLTVTFYASDGSVGTRTYGNLNFLRNEPKNATNADSKATWELPYVEMAEGFKWARRNVGAMTPEEYGDYFSWGETSPMSSYNYDYSIPFSDAATANLGSGWRTPTDAEWEALLDTDNYTWEWTTENGVNGYKVTSHVAGYDGNSIFLPAAGYNKPSYGGSSGYYWSSTLGTNDSRQAKELCFSSSARRTLDDARSWGFTIRAIYDPSTVTHEYVDMGSGIMFATTNIGAASPEDFGDFFAWGETTPKDSYSASNYNVTEFQDAANANWGYGWRMPTKNELVFLANSCDWEWTSVNGVNGYRVTSRENSSNSIFLPAAGTMEGSSPANSGQGWYWSSDLDLQTNTYAYEMFFMDGGYVDANNNAYNRYYGLPIRPVYGGGATISVTGVSFEVGNYAVLNGGTSALTATIAPADATNQNLTWTSSDPSVAIVSPTGVVTGKKVGTTTVTVRTVDGGFTATCTVAVIPNAFYVDMGNGTRWATSNVGADSPEESGGYYAWGETTTKSSYTWATYTYTLGASSGSNPSKYNATDGKTELESSDDAATANLGSNWRMPTIDEWTALKDNSVWIWAEMNGKKGYIVKSNITGYENSIIFFPAAGRYTESALDTIRNAYWLATGAGSVNARCIYFTSSTHTYTNFNRYIGCSVRAIYDPKQLIGGHEYVEMGDGLRWATMNVGASAPEAYGDYFAWGETTTKSNYAWSTYFDNPSGDGQTFTKYATDKKTRLDLDDDAARANWGSTWRMPTDAEWTALRNTTNFDWEWDDARKGYTVTSKVNGYAGNSIFLPAAGYRYGTSLDLAGSYGYYWSSSLREDYSDGARRVHFGSGGVGRSSGGRYDGFSVRPVSE